MKAINYPLYMLFLLFFSATVSAQYITVDDNVPFEDLVRDVLIDNPCANVSNITVTSWAFGAGNSYGYFTSGTSGFPFQDGVLLTTGRATSAIGPNSNILSEGPASWPGDLDLEQALGIVGSSKNATVLEFDFLPLANKISFDYIFSSEQYLTNPSPNQCSFTDGFVFLLKEANGTDQYENLAVVPGTGIPVKTNTVRGPGTICPASNEAYFDAFNGFEHPTNYNGQTVVMKAQANVTPGVLYHIKLVVADQGNNLYDSAIFLGGGSFNIGKDLGSDRTLANGNPLCHNETYILDATETGTNTYQWFKNNTPISGATNPTYTVQDAGAYSVQITLDGTVCTSTGGPINIEYAPVLNPSQATLVQCDDNNDGITVFNLLNATSQIITTDPNIMGVFYYENQNDPNPIDNASSYTSVPKTIFAKALNEYGCFSFIEVFLEIANNNVPVPAPIEVCDGDDNQDGIHEFDLTSEVTPTITNGLPAGLTIAYYATSDDALIEANPLPNNFSNTTPVQEIIWARILNGPDCYGIIPVTLIVNTFTAPDFEDQEKYLCEGFNSITLSVPDAYESYLWNDANASTTNRITVTSAREYTVTVTDLNGCEDTKKFIVEPSGRAEITSVEINDFAGGENSVLINYTGLGDYQFSIDGTNYQDSPLFINVPSGFYIVYVKDINGCGVKEKEIYVLDYPKFFTPNNDGFNDIWEIDYLRREHPRAKISIFDRYGKLLYSFSGQADGWDGNFNKQPLPASDYWFNITLENNRVIKGHFSLKR
ncbi:gliding motility-associated-like protein [Flavobacterium arsenatis]|uniref:Gliding motility-associated-like protein n=1 Tax=Flavobacterium arsenatis TaxID=1484332 RepID=A0ABU1TUD7_9FLAO|nr:choice-of-anchor L domain-containing protein [Flavobacterium arsenatis]MDR6969488.1 gliding motility-associated-like protein [Flavobacterium arsenatis]